MNENRNNSFLTEFFKNIDKSMRIVSPGFLIMIIFFWDDDPYKTLMKISEFNIFILVFCIIAVGLIFYSIHRSFISVIDLFGTIRIEKCCCKCLMKSAVKSFIKERSENEKRFYIFNASMHSAFMFFEIMIINYIFRHHDNCVELSLLILGFILLFLIKLFVTRLQYNLDEIS